MTAYYDKWSYKKKKQPVWAFFKAIVAPFNRVKEVVYLGEQLPKKCIMVSNHNNKKGPLVFEINLPILHAKWGAYWMLGGYKERFHYLRDVLYIQKNGLSKFKATLKGGFEAIFSLWSYKGLKVIPSFPDARLRRTLQYSMTVLEQDVSIMIYPEDSGKGYFDVMSHFFPGFVMLADAWYKKTGEDLPVFPIYYGRKSKKIVVGKPLYVQQLKEQGLNREEIAEKFRLEVNKLYHDHFLDVSDNAKNKNKVETK